MRNFLTRDEHLENAYARIRSMVRTEAESGAVPVQDKGLVPVNEGLISRVRGILEEHRVYRSPDIGWMLKQLQAKGIIGGESALSYTVCEGTKTTLRTLLERVIA